MFNMASRVQKIPLPLEFDHDFGKRHPVEPIGFFVSVLDKFDFILLLPFVESSEELLNLIENVMKTFFEPNARYILRELEDEDVENFKLITKPIISFDPDSVVEDIIKFFWQIPPRNLMA